jgi:hypothetical protein
MRRFGGQTEWMAHLVSANLAYPGTHTNFGCLVPQDADEYMVLGGSYRTLPQLLAQFPGSPGTALKKASGVHAVTFGMHSFGRCQSCKINCNHTSGIAVPVTEEWDSLVSAGLAAVHGTTNLHWVNKSNERTQLRASKTQLCASSHHNYKVNKVLHRNHDAGYGY